MYKNLIKKASNLAHNYSDQVVIATIMLTLAIVSTINATIEYNADISIAKLSEFLLENGFYIISYILLDTKFKPIKINFLLKNSIIILTIASIWTTLEFNFYIISHNNHLESYSSIIGKIFFKEFIDIFSFVISALIIQHVINKLVINNLYRQQAGFIGKIPASQRKDIYLIKSKENYIDVYYGGNAEHKLINYRFSNAIKEMPVNAGLQVHRSFWVNTEMLKTLKRIDNKYYLIIKGEKIPVSNTHLKTVKHINQSL